MSWRSVNRCLYRLASRLTRSRARSPRVAAPPTGEGEGLLYLTWGRLGDAVLAAPFTERLHELCPGPVVAVGRPEAGAVLAPRVDRFVPWSRAAEVGSLAPFSAVVTDLHVFHGGLGTVAPLLAAVHAKARITYEGYVPRDRFVPHRGFPAGVSVVPSLRKPDTGSDPEQLHVWNDLEHYHGALARELGAPDAEWSTLRPFLEPDPEHVRRTLSRFGLERGAYWACQPASSIAKKDYPVGPWQSILAAFPERRFVLLGSTAEKDRTRALRAGHARDLGGATDTSEAVALVAGAAGYVGLDSGLTHAAVALGVPTICIAQNANLGFFFPYPDRLGTTHLRVVHHPGYESCAGCFSLCAHEPLWRTYRQGALCLRTLPAELVIEAMRDPPSPRGATGPSSCEPRLRAR